jgi:hypothetical protein
MKAKAVRAAGRKTFFIFITSLRLSPHCVDHLTASITSLRRSLLASIT